MMLPAPNKAAETAFLNLHSESTDAQLCELIDAAIQEKRPQLAAQLVGLLSSHSPARSNPAFQRVERVLGWLIESTPHDHTEHSTQAWQDLQGEWTQCSAEYTRARLNDMRDRYREHYKRQSKQGRPRGPRRSR